MNELIRIETYSQVNLNYSNSLRLQIYKCGLQLIKNNYVFGYGIGNTQYKLNECYSESNQYKMINIYNSHNQYIDIVLKTGIIGLIVFLAFLSENIYYAKRTNNRLLLTIILSASSSLNVKRKCIISFSYGKWVSLLIFVMTKWPSLFIFPS